MPKAALLASILLVCGCFRELETATHESASIPAPTVEVSDAHGAAWEASNCPRRPRFVLRFHRPPAGNPERRLLLLRGAASEETLTDLRSDKRTEATQARLIELALSLDGARLTAEPRAALARGMPYTLVWVEASDAFVFPLRVSSSEAAGAELVGTIPAALDQRAAPNLKRILLRFDGYLAGPVETSFRLVAEPGESLEMEVLRTPCEVMGLDPGDCVELRPHAPLTPATAYRVYLQAGLMDATGALLPPTELAFRTSAEADDHGPLLEPMECAKDEASVGSLCVLASERAVALRMRADEHGIATAVVAGTQVAALSRAGEYRLEIPLESASRALLILTDAAGNRSELPVDVAPAEGLATLSISEVLADPLGPEPHQELVELLNFGDAPVPIMGFTLSSDPFRDGPRIVSASAVAPRERVLIVAPTFDVQDTSDGASHSGARLLRLSAPLSLKNDGAELFLRDARGRRVSASPALSAEQAGACITRVTDDPRTGELQAFRASTCTPGYDS